MITAVDSCILIDILVDDPDFADESARRMKAALARGAVVACAPVWAEVGAGLPTQARAVEVFDTLRVDFSEISVNAALMASEAFRAYRSGGGIRRRVASDFLIAAHAAVHGYPLLTRDAGLARLSIPGLVLAD